jgi:hypothetical protein
MRWITGAPDDPSSAAHLGQPGATSRVSSVPSESSLMCVDVRLALLSPLFLEFFLPVDPGLDFDLFLALVASRDLKCTLFSPACLSPPLDLALL